MERLKLGTTESDATKLNDGTTINAYKVGIKRPTPSPVAMHEAAHIVAAGEIVSATIIPSGSTRGKTHPVKMTAAAAAAAEALGHSGTSWDMYLTEYILGVDPGVAKSAARSALSGRSEEMLEVATLLEERRTIGQADVKEARENVKDKNLGIFPIKVEIITRGGERRCVTTQTFHGEVRIADLL